MPKFGHLGPAFWKTNVRFEISTLEIWYMLTCVKRLESDTFWPKRAKFGELKNEWKIPDFPKFTILDGFGSFRTFGGVVLAGFGSFWLVPGFSKYDLVLTK